jgi:hypothetical protein
VFRAIFPSSHLLSQQFSLAAPYSLSPRIYYAARSGKRAAKQGLVKILKIWYAVNGGGIKGIKDDCF